MIDKENSMQGIPQVRYPGNINMKLSPDTNVSSPIGESNSDIKDSSSTDSVPITAEEVKERQKAVTQLKADMGYDAATREEILDRLKGYKLYLAKEYSADVDGLTEFRKKHFGKLNIVTTVYGRKI